MPPLLLLNADRLSRARPEAVEADVWRTATARVQQLPRRTGESVEVDRIVQDVVASVRDSRGVEVDRGWVKKVVQRVVNWFHGRGKGGKRGKKNDNQNEYNQGWDGIDWW